MQVDGFNYLSGMKRHFLTDLGLNRLTKCWPLIVLGGIFSLSGCVWDSEEEVFPDNNTCDTSMVSFTFDIVPVLSSHCLGCHSNSNASVFGGGIRLEDYEDVAGYSERIIGAINHRDGFLPMPRGSNKLDPCPINQFEAWVNSGKPEN